MVIVLKMIKFYVLKKKLIKWVKLIILSEVLFILFEVHFDNAV
jgi:hypothetical protein